MGKRFLSLFLCCCIVLMLVPAAYITVEAAPGILYGDADDSKTIDLQDVLLMERFIAGEQVVINEKNADVNSDGIIDDEDVRLVREYLVGNLPGLTPELCTVTFDLGNGKTEDIQVGKGYSIQKEIPSAEKNGFIFTGWQKDDGTPFYQEDPVTQDIRLTATYDEIDFNEKLFIDSFALTDQSPSLSFRIEADFDTVQEVAAKLSVIPKDGSDPVEIQITKDGEGIFSVKAKEGFTPGASYTLTLGSGLTFEDKDPALRTVVFVIEKEQKDDLRYSESLIFIKDTAQMNYTIGDNTIEMLELGLFTNSGDNEKIEGTFMMPGTSLKANDYVCIYENVNPKYRDYMENDYQEDRLAYIKITGVSGEDVSFESLGGNDVQHVLQMPESVPIRVTELPSAQTGQIDPNDYDAHARTVLGFKTTPVYREGDFLIFYTVQFESLTKDTPVRYAQVTGAQNGVVSYKLIEKDDIDSYMGMFISQRIDNDDVIDKIDPAMLDNIQKQAEDSGFVEEAIDHMLQSALETDTLKQSLLKSGLTPEEIAGLNAIQPFAASEGNDSRFEFKRESLDVKPRKIKDNDKHFESGWGIGLDIRAVFSLEKKVSETVTNSLKIDLTVSFEQELAVDLNVNIEDKWDWYFCIPVLEELSCFTSVDIRSFSSVSVGARIYTVESTEKDVWKTVTSKLASPELQKALQTINQLGVLVKKNSDNIDKAKEYAQKLSDMRKELPNFDIDGETISFDEMEKRFGMTDVGLEFEEVLSADNAAKSKVGLEKLVDKYADMLNQESDWINLYQVTMLEKEIHIKVVAIKFKVDFSIKVNVNISLGADLEYQTGKRYNFWVHVMARTAGSNEMDLIDERFAFQFYVMGAIGIKAGIEAEIAVGVISTQIASIGATVEFGPYLRIYGYFFYTYTKLRPLNTTEWFETSEQIGAIYLEFGLYLIVKFKAQVFDGTFEYNPTLYENEFPLLSAGVQKNVYSFANEPKKTDTLQIVDNDDKFENGVQMLLPSSYRLMKTLDLRTGVKLQEIYETGRFIYRLSNSHFSIDSAGMITVTPPDQTRYMKCDLTITWTSDKLAFSKYDMSITIPLIWTNLTDAEQKETFTASFAVGNIKDGYQIVDSKTYLRKDTFDLPSQEKILELIGYNNYNAEDGTNLKYSNVSGYTTDKTTGLTLTADTTFYFDVTLRKYTLTIYDVQYDGKTENRTYSTTYGNHFDLSELSLTGIRNPSEGLYTSFRYVAKKGDQTAVFDPSTVVNMNFYRTYGETAVLEAVYHNEALTATYTFLGIDAPAKKVVFRNGEVPYFEGIADYVREHGGENAVIMEISPVVEPVGHDIRYTVLCQPNNQKPKHTLSFESNGGNSVKAQVYPEGTPTQRPTDPMRTGYTFAGWYTDSGLQQIFDFGPMPEGDVTVYAGWQANLYRVTFWSDSKTVAEQTVEFNSTYGTLPSPEKKNDFKFTGWYTKQEGGEKITSETIFDVTGNIALYAQWQEKATIDINKIIYSSPQKYIYDKTGKPFQFSVADDYAGLKGFVLTYTKVGSNSEWSSTIPVNAGEYNVKIQRPTDDDYKIMQEIVVNGGVSIEKKTPTIKLGTLYKMGNLVRVTPPESDSDGEFTHCLEVTNSSGVTSYGAEENTTGLFTRVAKGTLKYYVKYSEGENYKAVDTSSSNYLTESSGNVEAGGYRVDVRIKTGGGLLAGTDNDIHGGVAYFSNYLYRVVFLPPHIEKFLKYNGDSFDRNKDETFTIDANIDPWDVSNVTLRKTGTDDWEMEWADIIVVDNSNSNRNFTKRFAQNKTFTHNPDYWDENQVTSLNSSVSFLRNITDVSEFYNGGAGTIDLKTPQSTDYTYAFSGTIKDQFYPNGYNCLTHVLGPGISVTSGNKNYDQFIRYTGVASFKIDTAGLAAYLKEHGGSDFKYTVTMEFYSPTILQGNPTSYTKEITVSAPSAAKQVSSVSEPMQLSNTSGNFAMAAMPMTQVLSSNSQIVLFAETLGAKKGQFIEVPVKIEGSEPLWGIWGDISYDSDVLELTGCRKGNLFTDEGVTLHNDLTSVPYRFLVTRTDLNDAAVNGSILTLTFRVKEDSEDQASAIILNLLQGINAQGQEISFETRNGAVLIDSQLPVISGIENGGIYYTTQLVAVTDTNLQSVTLNGDVTTAPVTLNGNTNAIYTIIATDKSGNTATCTVTMKTIDSLAEAIESITSDNVKSSDKAVIEGVRSNVGKVDIANATTVEKNALKEISEQCDALLSKIFDTAVEIKRITDAVNSYDIATVKSTDREFLENLVQDIDAAFNSGNLTEDEKVRLETAKTQANTLLARISEAAEALTKKEIVDADNINKGNVVLRDKETLLQAKAALEAAMEKYKGNYTQTELITLKDRLTSAIAALDAIYNSENVVRVIIDLPEPSDVKASDKDAIYAAKALYDALTDTEKAMVGSEYVTKLNSDLQSLDDLGKDKNPQTGDTRYMFLWVDALLVSGGTLAIFAIKRKRKTVR